MDIVIDYNKHSRKNIAGYTINSDDKNIYLFRIYGIGIRFIEDKKEIK